VGGPARRAGGDVTARWRCWLQETTAALDAAGDEGLLDPDGALEGPRGPLTTGVQPSKALLEVLPDLVRGTELAAARLVVASLDPDLDELAVDTAVVTRG
jgi:hypothetical protein